MACHLDGGICPHDYPMGRGGSYPVLGSSSYGGGSSYATLGAYNMENSGTYQGNVQTTGVANPISLVGYAANQTYNGAYRGAGAYNSQRTSQKSLGMKNAVPVFDVYRNDDREREKMRGVNGQVVPELRRESPDSAQRYATIDETVAPNAVAVQRDFLEQMIKNARTQNTTQRQPQYATLYQ